MEVHVYSDADRERTYIPSVKPFLWMKYLEEDKTREQGSYFYIDSDVLFREIPELTRQKIPGMHQTAAVILDWITSMARARTCWSVCVKLSG